MCIRDSSSASIQDDPTATSYFNLMQEGIIALMHTKMKGGCFGKLTREAHPNSTFCPSLMLLHEDTNTCAYKATLWEDSHVIKAATKH
eukprot:5100325-Ditylum_brightwellii.AAC.1